MLRRLLVAALTLAGLVSVPSTAQAVTPWRCERVVGYMLNVPDVWTDSDMRTFAIRDAVSMLEAGTGQRYRFDGYTRWKGQTATIDEAPDDLVIQVVPGRTTDFLSGTSYAAYATWTTTHAVVTIDYNVAEAIKPGLYFDGGMSVFTLTEHELGHSVGLEHSSDPADVMYPNLENAPAFYSVNDRANLAASACR